jgi:Cu/Ag efflux pump CusA
VRIYGPELPVLRSLGEQVRQALAPIDGIAHLNTELQKDIPQIEVKVDLAKAARYGIKPGDVHRAAGALVNGIEIGDVYKDNKAYDIALWSIPSKRASLTTIQEALLDTAGGGHVRLAEVADVRIVPTPSHTEHENTQRRFDVSANVRGRDLGSVAADVDRRLKEVKFPLGYHAEVIGEEAERRVAQRRLLLIAAVAAVGILLMLQLAVGTWRLAGLAFLLLPAALVGGVLAAYAGGGVISLGSLVGFLTVLGISARNGILLIDHCRHLERYEGETHGPQLVLRGARERLSPILMTSLCTGFALLPLVYWGNSPGHEVEYPLAVVVVGGLITSTLLSLFVIPSLYLRFGSSPKPTALQPAAA